MMPKDYSVLMFSDILDGIDISKLVLFESMTSFRFLSRIGIWL